MTEDELRSKINLLKGRIKGEIAKNKSEEQFQELFLLGADIIGELFIDIKRIADVESSARSVYP